MNTWKPETQLAIVADSIESLRACDVYWLLDTAPTCYAMNRMTGFIKRDRPDLAELCRETGIKIIHERLAEGDRGKAWFEFEMPTHATT